jgi:hypothetical protein
MLKLLSRVLLAALVLGAALLGSAPSSAAPALATRSSDEAGVRVVVTPKALGRDVTVWEFNVVMDTHTKPLNDNLAQAAVLVDEAGRRYVPVAWQGDPPGGHHRKGVLQFSPPAEISNYKSTVWAERQPECSDGRSSNGPRALKPISGGTRKYAATLRLTFLGGVGTVNGSKNFV